MLSDRDLLRAHAAALFTQDAAGRLLRVNEPGGKAAPRFFLGCTRQGYDRWFRHDVSDEAVRSLEAGCAGADSMDLEEPPPERTSPFEEVLERSAPVSAVWRGPAFRFRDLPGSSGHTIVITGGNANLLRPPLDAWREDVARGALLCAVVVGDQAVSVCASVRQTAVVHEAGVETAPEFRGKGYAVDAVTAWAAAVMRLNRVPLYSTSWENAASLALARKLDLVQYASDLHIT